MIVGSFGDVVFSVSSLLVRTLDDISISYKSRIAKHEIIGNKPKLEYQGEDLTEISFKMRFDRSFGVDPDNELRKLEDQKGMACIFFLGDKYYGDFLITSIGNDIQRTLKDGSTLVAEVSVSLQEYIYD